MSLDMKFETTISISADEVKRILTEVICQKSLFEKVESIDFKIARRSVGYGMGERDEWYFDGCKANVIMDLSKE
jgi:hypothetical protein